MTENNSSFVADAVTIDTPTDALIPSETTTKPRTRISFLRMGVVCLMVAVGWSSGYMMAPQQVVLMEPQDDDLVVLNGCVISACSYMASVRAQHRLDSSFWSRVMLVKYQETSAGHAYCVWQTDGQIFGYDRAGGTFSIPTNSRDPKNIAETLATGLEKVMKRPMSVARAEFVEPKNAHLYTY